MLNLSVAVDARCLNVPNMRGMGKYVHEMISHMPNDRDIQWIFLSDRPDLPFHFPLVRNNKTFINDCRGYRFHVWEQLMLPLIARRQQAHVLHCAATTLPVWQPLPTVVTVHDTLYWTERLQGTDEKHKSIYWDNVVPRALSKANAIITISQRSLRDILALWPCLEGKVTVIPHGVSDRYLESKRQVLGPQGRDLLEGTRYILYVGGALERKRFRWALEVVREVRKKEPGVVLAACGFSKEEVDAATDSVPFELRNAVKILAFVSEEQMPALYCGASVVLYPTLYEGFGLPVIESLATGTPILFSALGSLEELQGPGAVVLPPFELQPWVDAVCRALGSEDSREMRQTDGRIWASGYSWAHSSKKHLDVYIAARNSVAGRRA